MQIEEIKGAFKDTSNLNNIPKQTIDLINKFKDIPSGGYEHGDGIKLENGDSFITKSLGENTILMQGKTTDIRYNCYKYRLGKTDEISELNVKNDIIDYYKKDKKILMSPKTHIRIEMIDGVEVRINDDNTIKRNGIDIGNIKDAKEIYVGKYRTSIITQIGTKFIYDNNGNLIKIIPNKDDMGESLKEVFNQADKDFDMYIDARKNTDYSNYIEYLKNDTDKFSLFENIIAYYMVMLDSIGLKDYSNEEKLLYAEEMFNYDRKHGYNMLEKVPIIKNGTVETNVKETEYDYEGDYVYLYNSEGLPKKAPLAVLGTDSNGKLYYDTLESEGIDEKQYIKLLGLYNVETNKYISKFDDYVKDQLDENIEATSIIYRKQDNDFEYDVGGFCTKISGDQSGVIFFADAIMNFEKESVSNFSVGGLVHEYGHALANSYSKKHDYDSIYWWDDVYKQVYGKGTHITDLETGEKYTKSDQLRSYAYTDEFELFAEAFEEFYYDKSGYAKNDLKMVDIDVKIKGNKYDNLYDLMDDIVEGDLASKK